ncbi:MAG: FlgD immunoglobulin-like domain containing protein [candidate division KSB1 bacterium]|nr:FlgD immunoglobulin-like domain containing protein [candidate division KSB1 bacterium]
MLIVNLPDGHPAATLSIYNTLGQRIKQFHIPANQQVFRAQWHGKDSNGLPVSSGTFWGRLSSNNTTVKLLYLK